MAAIEAQIVDQVELTGSVAYEFTGNSATIERKLKFLEAYREQGTIYHAAQHAGIDRVTYYRWSERDPAFAAAFADCHEDTYDQLETSGFKKALAGDTLLTMFYLKAHRPKFRDRVQVDIEAVDTEIRERMRSNELPQDHVKTLLLPHESDNSQKD